MPKIGIEPQRKADIVDATIYELGKHGSLEVTVAKIARRAGTSSALAFHYFGSKEQIFLAAMRHVMTLFGAEVRDAISTTTTPHERLKGIIAAAFSPTSFTREVVSAWLNFYVLAQNEPNAEKLLSIYHRRLKSNLIFSLRPLVGERAEIAADALGAMIDGLYLRAALAPKESSFDRDKAVSLVLDTLSQVVGET